MPIVADHPPVTTARATFFPALPPLGTAPHPNQVRTLEQRLAANHLARTIDQAVARLDLSQLVCHLRPAPARRPIPPIGLLGRRLLRDAPRPPPSPPEWHGGRPRSANRSAGLLRGSAVSRSCWYGVSGIASRRCLPDLHQQTFGPGARRRPHERDAARGRGRHPRGCQRLAAQAGEPRRRSRSGPNNWRAALRRRPAGGQLRTADGGSGGGSRAGRGPGGDDGRSGGPAGRPLRRR